MGVENNIFWSAIRSGFGEPGTNPHQEFLVVPPSGHQEQGVNHVIIIIPWNITVFASPLSISLSFTFLKLFLFTQSLVRVLYPVRVLYSVRSPDFIPSPYFTPGPQSVVRSPQSMFYTDRTCN